MIGLDGNGLLPFSSATTNGGPTAARVVPQAIARREPVVLNRILLVEMASVLATSYS